LGWEAVLFTLVAGSLQGLIAAGLATAFGIPLVPELPEDALEGDEPSTDAAPAGDPEQVVETAGSAAPMMVFGPMLALSALEFLFFGDAIVGWVSWRLGG
jgi:prepilin signal peptidase PulO-like enzyme (type II secretory pathway)